MLSLRQLLFGLVMQHALSQTGNRGCCVRRPNNGFEGDNSKHGMRHFIFTEKYLDNRDNKSHNICVSSDKLGFFFLSFCDI